jgi:hypothetical protein
MRLSDLGTVLEERGRIRVTLSFMYHYVKSECVYLIWGQSWRSREGGMERDREVWVKRLFVDDVK